MSNIWLYMSVKLSLEQWYCQYPIRSYLFITLPTKLVWRKYLSTEVEFHQAWCHCCLPCENQSKFSGFSLGHELAGLWLFSGFLSALTELGDMEGYGHVYIGPFNPALCHAAALLAQHWEVGLASPGCLDADWPNLPPINPPSRVLFTVLRFFHWAHVAVISGKGVRSMWVGVVWHKGVEGGSYIKGWCHCRQVIKKSS